MYIQAKIYYSGTYYRDFDIEALNFAAPYVKLAPVEVGIDEVAAVEVRVRVRLQVAVEDFVLADLEGRVKVDEGRLDVVVEGDPVDLGLLGVEADVLEVVLQGEDGEVGGPDDGAGAEVDAGQRHRLVDPAFAQKWKRAVELSAGDSNAQTDLQLEGTVALGLHIGCLIL